MNIRREIRLWVKAFWVVVAQYELRWDQYRCFHEWRPIRLNDKPARMCKFCDKAEQLTPEMFFAYFGEVGGFNR